ncbi:hypothetical protein MN116_006879 [Schistosoma mekongi]|uniref:MMS19 nucleotide excision repair protein n=1 Tax=Schistosoma mekongi TaxID=38744 RepID=A0AAE2D3W3_SCHME|nr:hypothetical protein MN116_006879 [Schistosoma mekongi]
MESLLDLIQSLESGLTNTKISSQKESMETLITGMKNMPSSNMTCKEIDHLVDFLSDRLALADPNITNLILDGFLWLTKSKWSIDGCSMINPEQAKRIVEHGVFGHLTIQNLAKSGRLKVFQLLHYFLTGSQLSGIQSMESSFIKNYLIAIDEEKDPQILHLIFCMNVIIIREFPSVIDFKEELFETISVYFPIDFSPPPGGGIAGITRDLLVSSLHQCLFAMRNISGHSLMLLICEKLESQWPNGQLDALSLLSDCLHGRVQCINDKDSHVASDRNPIDIRHISPFLGVIVPVLIKIGEEIEKRRDKTDLCLLVLSCISGLVHAHSVQTNEKFQLEDFTVILLRSIGLLSNESNQRQPPSALTISKSITVDYVLESFKCAQNNILLSSILFMYTIPRLCTPLFSDSVTNSCDQAIITEKLKINIDELTNWQSCIYVLDRIFHSITEENLINALHYDQQLLKLLNIIKINTNFIINMIKECLPNSYNLTISSTLTYNEKSIHFLICLCRLFYSLIKYTSSENDDSSSSSSYVDSIINAICSTIQWLDNTLRNNNNNLFNYEVLRSIKDELLSFIPIIYNSCVLFACKLDEFLFDYLKNCQVEQTVLNNSNCFTMDILKYCSCKNLSLLQTVLEFILEKCNKNMLSLDSESSNNVFGFQYWAKSFNSLLYFICEYIIENSMDTNTETDQLVVQSYLSGLCQNVKLFLNIMNHYSCCKNNEFVLNEINKMNFIFRIITSQCNSSEQTRLFRIYKHYFDEMDYNHTEMYPVALGLFTILCGIIAGLRPDVIISINPVQLLDFIMDNSKRILCTPSSTITTTNTSSISSSVFCCSTTISSILAQTYASVLNKSDDNFALDITNQLSTSLGVFWSVTERDSSNELRTFICFWLLWSIRSLLSTLNAPDEDNGDNNHSYHKKWSDYLIQSIILKSDTTDDLWMSTFQRIVSSNDRILYSINCFKQADRILLESMKSTDCVLSCFSHCCIKVDSYIQNVLKCFHDHIYHQLTLLINHITLQSIDCEKVTNIFTSFRNAMLTLYLKMAIRFPTEFFTDQFVNKIMRFALFAITSCSDIECQLAGLKFISIVISGRFTKSFELLNIISENQANDLLENLPKLVYFSNGQEMKNKEVLNLEDETNINMLTCSIRLITSRCLCNLIKLLPEQFINRHRDVNILPLLDQLVDDPNRYVRIEAVQARNLWLT